MCRCAPRELGQFGRPHLSAVSVRGSLRHRPYPYTCPGCSFWNEEKERGRERPEKGRQSQCDRFVNHFVKRLVTLILWIISVLKHSKVSSRESLAESLYCSPAYLMPESGSSMCQRLTMMLHFQFVSCPPVWGAGRSAPILRSLVGHATRGLQYSSAFLCFPPPVHQSRSEAIWS